MISDWLGFEDESCMHLTFDTSPEHFPARPQRWRLRVSVLLQTWFCYRDVDNGAEIGPLLSEVDAMKWLAAVGDVL